MLPRNVYASLHGPTVCDRVRLEDTSLILGVEENFASYGEEAVFGGGKVIRDGQGQGQAPRESGTPGLVVINAVVVDACGIFEADVGIRDSLIAAIGKAGNPDIQDGISPGLEIGPSADIAVGEGKFLTAGVMNYHVHFISPQHAWEARYSGVTTMIGSGTGLVTGTNATTATPGVGRYTGCWMPSSRCRSISAPWERATPPCRRPQAPRGLGTTPATIDTALSAADEMDGQVAIHTDTLNESSFVETTIGAFRGRAIHTYHSKGVGRDHALDILQVMWVPNVLPSSTNSTMPYTCNTLDEHLDMLMVCHHLNPQVPEDAAFAESRIRPETMAAEDVFHHLGAISIIASDSQATGRVGGVISRTWQTADNMKRERGPLAEDSARHDNFRIRRYIAKYTINPAIAQGISQYVGSVTPEKSQTWCCGTRLSLGPSPTW